MKIDTEKRELELFTTPYMAAILEKLSGDKTLEFTSKQAWDYVLGLGIKISRTAVILGLTEMKNLGYLTSRLESGKGGYHDVYRCPFTKVELMALVLNRTVDAFPEETAKRVLETRVK